MDVSVVEFHGPEVRPGYPDTFRAGYTLRKSAVSPDGKYGVIFPNRLVSDEGADFIVDRHGPTRSCHDFWVTPFSAVLLSCALAYELDCRGALSGA
jgi:hypothetical protein